MYDLWFNAERYVSIILYEVVNDTFVNKTIVLSNLELIFCASCFNLWFTGCVPSPYPFPFLYNIMTDLGVNLCLSMVKYNCIWTSCFNAVRWWLLGSCDSSTAKTYKALLKHSVLQYSCYFLILAWYWLITTPNHQQNIYS